MNRRAFLAASTFAALRPSLGVAESSLTPEPGVEQGASGQTSASQNTSSQISPGRISAISDEIAMSPEEAIAFAQHFGLKWLELRDVPALPGHGKPYYFLPDAELRASAKTFKDAGIKISFLNTNLCKNALPDSAPVSWTKHDADWRTTRGQGAKQEFDERFKRLDRCLAAAEAFECPYIRIFTFLRVGNAGAVYEQVSHIIGEMAERTQKAGFLLLVENEPSCNVGDSAELTDFLKLVPEKTLGFNWDARNAMGMGEVPFPDGYHKLPKHRMKNAQIKGHDILDPDKPIDWAPIFSAMNADGYAGQIGLETHYFDGTKLERSHLAMDKILNLITPGRV
jgi:sugar phosphate isomerase/epimerase